MQITLRRGMHSRTMTRVRSQFQMTTVTMMTTSLPWKVRSLTTRLARLSSSRCPTSRRTSWMKSSTPWTPRQTWLPRTPQKYWSFTMYSQLRRKSQFLSDCSNSHPLWVTSSYRREILILPRIPIAIRLRLTLETRRISLLTGGWVAR